MFWNIARAPIGSHVWTPLAKQKQMCTPGKKSLSHTPRAQKEKKLDGYECMLSLPIGCMKFLSPKLLVTIFGLG